MPPVSTWRGHLLALTSGTAGALLFYALHLPLPWILGALLGALLASYVPGLRVAPPKPLATPARAVLGVAIGAVFSADLLRQAGAYATSIAILLPFLVAAIWAGYRYFTRVAGFDRQTAFFCSLPGGMIEMTLISAGYGADLRRVALIHTTRLLLIVYSVPFAIHAWTHADLSGRTRIAGELGAVPPGQWAVLVTVAWLGWWLMHRARLPGSSIVGPMLLAALAYGTGVATVRVPDELINAAQLVLGTTVGCQFVGIAFREVLHAIGMTLGYFVLLMLMAMGAAAGVHLLTDIPLVATVLAFIPGGQAEMNVISLLVGVAVPYIAIHHVMRMLLVITIAPALTHWLLGEAPTGHP